LSDTKQQQRERAREVKRESASMMDFLDKQLRDCARTFKRAVPPPERLDHEDDAEASRTGRAVCFTRSALSLTASPGTRRTGGAGARHHGNHWSSGALGHRRLIMMRSMDGLRGDLSAIQGNSSIGARTKAERI
jgi:hypothetical protein